MEKELRHPAHDCAARRERRTDFTAHIAFRKVAYRSCTYLRVSAIFVLDSASLVESSKYLSRSREVLGSLSAVTSTNFGGGGSTVRKASGTDVSV